MQVAVGRRDRLSVFGGDYDTPDGSAIRDYIHVVDLAEGHVAALDMLAAPNDEDVRDPSVGPTGCRAINLGTGTGHSVLEVLAAAGRIIDRPVPHEVVGRRAGDIERIWADPSLAADLLGWRATRGLDEMLADHWRWQQRHPDGYAPT
jgi:UDP-glucose 4-epimerase